MKKNGFKIKERWVKEKHTRKGIGPYVNKKSDSEYDER